MKEKNDEGRKKEKKKRREGVEEEGAEEEGFLLYGKKSSILGFHDFARVLHQFLSMEHNTRKVEKTKQKMFFHLIFVVIQQHFWRYVDFRGRSGAQENLYFRRR
jgi:hypothetical protein